MDKITQIEYNGLKVECFRINSKTVWIVAYPDGTSFKSESLEEVFTSINNKQSEG